MAWGVEPAEWVPWTRLIDEAFGEGTWAEPSRRLQLPGDQARAVTRGNLRRAANRRSDPMEDRRPDPTVAEEAVQPNRNPTERPQMLLEEIDNMLVDEIDEVLEENAEEFVRNFVQKPGRPEGISLG